MATCPDCKELLSVQTDAEHYRRTGEYRYTILCDCGERPATDDDEDLIEAASEDYWLHRWSTQ